MRGASGRTTRVFKVRNATRDALLADSATSADGPVRRGVGLMGRKALPQGAGLIIAPCSGVVSFFMRFPIDVLFLAADNTVCHQVRNLVPWRMSKVVRASKQVVELPSGTLDSTGTRLGDLIVIEDA